MSHVLHLGTREWWAFYFLVAATAMCLIGIARNWTRKRRDELEHCREGCAEAAKQLVAQASVIHECQQTLEHAQQNVRALTGGDERRIAKALAAIAALRATQK